jgi:hypothetical protein
MNLQLQHDLEIQNELKSDEATLKVVLVANTCLIHPICTAFFVIAQSALSFVICEIKEKPHFYFYIICGIRIISLSKLFAGEN